MHAGALTAAAEGASVEGPGVLIQRSSDGDDTCASGDCDRRADSGMGTNILAHEYGDCESLVHRELDLVALDRSHGSVKGKFAVGEPLQTV